MVKVYIQTNIHSKIKTKWFWLRRNMWREKETVEFKGLLYLVIKTIEWKNTSLYVLRFVEFNDLKGAKGK